MDSLIVFDQRGVAGPVATLMYNTPYYNPEGVSKVTDALAKNYFNLTGIHLKGKEEFCAFIAQKKQSESPITPLEILSTAFFQNMQRSGPPHEYHEIVLNAVVPRMLQTIQQEFPQATLQNDDTPEIKNWMVGFVESYMNEEQIKNYCEGKASDAELMKERGEIGKVLYGLCASEQVTEKDLNILHDGMKHVLPELVRADKPGLILEFISKYLTLFLKAQDPNEFGTSVLTGLSGNFKQKFWPTPKENTPEEQLTSTTH
jgi:hypothetical protein